ncbi:MAG TPA: phosphopantetheine-binding protein [Mycobacteriales bacterium]
MAAPAEVDVAVAAATALVLDLDPATVDRDQVLTGADSIDLVEIAEVVEASLRPRHPRFTIDDDVLAEVTTVGELADHAAARLPG